MTHRVRTGWLAGTGALVLLLSLSGGALGATLVTDSLVGAEVTEPIDTSATFEDLDGNGVDDDCDEAVVADPEAAAAAFAAADLDADGTISVSEAAHSGWTGGANCNHGGYVSQVARADDAACEEPVVDDEPAEAIVATADEPADEVEEVEEAAECESAETEDDAAPVEETACEVVEAPEPDPAFDPTVPGSHGAWVAWVAGSDAVGGKNCNHGGAVSEAAKKDHEAARAEREAAKATRAAEKAERAAARELRAQEREAAKAARPAGKGKAKGN